MKIREHRKQLQDRLEELANGASYGEYLSTESGGEILRGPHVDVMIPAALNPKVSVFDEIFNLFDEVLCDLTWDGTVQQENHGGGIYSGKYYKLVMDIV